MLFKGSNQQMIQRIVLFFFAQNPTEIKSFSPSKSDILQCKVTFS